MTVRLLQDPRGHWWATLVCDGVTVRATWALSVAFAVGLFRAQRRMAGVAGDL